jgi:hypothetical protein
MRNGLDAVGKLAYGLDLVGGEKHIPVSVTVSWRNSPFLPPTPQRLSGNPKFLCDLSGG